MYLLSSVKSVNHELCRAARYSLDRTAPDDEAAAKCVVSRSVMRDGDQIRYMLPTGLCLASDLDDPCRHYLITQQSAPETLIPTIGNEMLNAIRCRSRKQWHILSCEETPFT